ncbi:hypothetical protein NLM59_04115 [Weeksellaceae bacterium KMM 9724]|uniref:hypothetical protein n=1 Tax=Profundicola chukchiensis TaxID=2961959 RepID=UPI0024382C8E|nr:hypothetical protein [Profundicola chukchiensis]MDG4950098.1 hypothetical protein [Profundicola chukchiensis]
MRNFKLLTLFAIMFSLLVRCTTDDEGNPAVQSPIDIPTKINNIEIPFATIDGTTLPGPINIRLNVDFDEAIGDAVPGLGLNNVASAELVDFYVELDDSSFVGDLTAIEDMDIYVKANGPDLEEIKVAEVRGNTAADRINFEVVSNEDLIDYFKADDLYLVLRDIKAGDSSLTTFTISATPVWKASFQL